MLYIYLPVLYYHGNLYVTEGAYPGGRGFPMSQRSFLFIMYFSIHHLPESLSYVHCPTVCR